MCNNTPLISVVVPVYNVETYINRCLNSIVNQSYRNIEIILVDDGSCDRSSSICDEWAEREKRVKVVHKENGGLSSARNTGLELFNGDYISFVDSDDWIELNMIEYLYNLIKKYNADYSEIALSIDKDENVPIKPLQERITILEKDELFNLFFRVKDKDIHYYATNKLYRRSCLERIRFWNGMLFEDIDFNYQLLKQCNKGVCSNRIMYHWFYNDNSITRNSLRKRDMELLDVWNRIVDDCNQDMPQYVYYAEMNYKRAHMGLLAKAAKFGVSEDYYDWIDDKNYLMDVTRESYRSLIKWNMPINRKVLLTFLSINFQLVSVPFSIVRNVKKKLNGE